MSTEENWLACMHNDGTMESKLFFTPAFTPDTVNVKSDSSDVPKTIVLDSIDACAEYTVDLKKGEIVLSTLKKYDNTGYKP